MEAMSDDLSGSGSGSVPRQPEYRQMIHEMRSHNFDAIRFASYRTASKLRFIQKKTNLYLVDIWNIIEAFRENALNTLEPHTEVNVSRLETLISSLYHNLNKRLPAVQQIHIDSSTGLLLNWLLMAYDRDNAGKIRVLSIKMALATMCAGKLMDKLRYVFSQISDGNGHMVGGRFSEYLREVLSLPAAVYESPSFTYSDDLVRSVFDGGSKVTVNDFLDTLMSDPGPQCLVWLPLLHRLANVESVLHPMQCEGCKRDHFSGFRYKCQRCANYQLCQECFWRGKCSGSHTVEHEMKEYTTYSASKQIGHSLRKSFRCVPEKSRSDIPRFPDEPEKPLNLSHIVPSKLNSSLETSRVDDEHRLIARYAARLATDAKSSARSPSESSLSLDTSRAQRELIQQLEAKNREIIREIARLRRQQELEAAAGFSGEANPALMAELQSLRDRKEELECHLGTLQDSRRQLMVQLEGLMKLLKNHQASPRSTPNSSPRSTQSPPFSSSYVPSSRSAPATPGSHSQADSLLGVGGDVKMAFGSSSLALSSRSLRNDLLVAADSVTNAMSSLVRELNSDGSDDGEGTSHITKPLSESREFETDGNESALESLDGNALWREEMHKRLEQESQFLAEIRARNLGNGEFVDDVQEDLYPEEEPEYQQDEVPVDDEDYLKEKEEDEELYDNDPRTLPRHHSGLPTDDESYARTDDDESYIKTDDDEGGGTDWEETMKRWVNR